MAVPFTARSSRGGTAFGVALVFLTVSLLANSCATVVVTTVNRDAPVRDYEKKSGPTDPFTYQAACQEGADLVVDCLVEAEGSCSTTKVHVIDRVVETRRSTSTFAKVFEYATAATFLAAGAGVTADAHNVAGRDDPGRTNAVGRTGAYAIGISLAAVGTGLLALAITDSAKALDSESHAGEIENADPARTFRCDRRPLREEPLRGRIRDVVLDLGRTDSDGHARIDVAKAVPADLVLGKNRATTLNVLYRDATLRALDLTGYRRALCTSRIQVAAAAGSLEAELEFFDACPDAVGLLGNRIDLTDLSVAAVKAIAAKCKGKADEAVLDACDDMVARVEASVPGQEAKGLRDSLSARRAALVEKKRLEAERQERAEKARMKAWSQRHVTEAKRAAISEVLDHLRAPSTARILRTTVLMADGNEYFVQVVVDAQNAFGVFLRGGYCVGLKLQMENPERYVPTAVDECGVN